MKIRDATGKVFQAELSTGHAASSYGQPVLVVGGLLALGPGDVLRGWELAECSQEEAEALTEAGFVFEDFRGAL